MWNLPADESLPMMLVFPPILTLPVLVMGPETTTILALLPATAAVN